MKKILLILALLITASQLKAQEDPKLHFGLKVSPSLAWIKTDTKGLNIDGTKFGFGYGLMTEFRFSKQYYFATGVDITYRGGSLKESNSNYDTTTTIEKKYTLQYVELPITMKLKTNEIGQFTYFLQFGVAPGINIRAKADTMTTTQIGSLPVSLVEENGVDIKDDINILNLSMIISAGLEYNLSGTTNFLTAVTFNNGFLDIFDGNAIKGNTNFLALTLGILF